MAVCRFLLSTTYFHSMDISEKDVKEFQSLFKLEFNEDISFAEAKLRFNELLALYELFMQPIPDKQLAEIEDRKVP